MLLHISIFLPYRSRRKFDLNHTCQCYSACLPQPPVTSNNNCRSLSHLTTTAGASHLTITAGASHLTTTAGASHLTTAGASPLIWPIPRLMQLMLWYIRCQQSGPTQTHLFGDNTSVRNSYRHKRPVNIELTVRSAVHMHGRPSNQSIIIVKINHRKPTSCRNSLATVRQSTWRNYRT